MSHGSLPCEADSYSWLLMKHGSFTKLSRSPVLLLEVPRRLYILLEVGNIVAGGKGFLPVSRGVEGNTIYIAGLPEISRAESE